MKRDWQKKQDIKWLPDKWLRKIFTIMILDKIVETRDNNFDDNCDGDKRKNVGTGRDLSLRIKPLPEIVVAFKTTTSKLIHQLGHNDFQQQIIYF